MPMMRVADILRTSEKTTTKNTGTHRGYHSCAVDIVVVELWKVFFLDLYIDIWYTNIGWIENRP